FAAVIAQKCVLLIYCRSNCTFMPLAMITNSCKPTTYLTALNAVPAPMCALPVFRWCNTTARPKPRCASKQKTWKKLNTPNNVLNSAKNAYALKTNVKKQPAKSVPNVWRAVEPSKLKKPNKVLPLDKAKQQATKMKLSA